MTKNNLKRLLGSQNNPFKESSGSKTYGTLHTNICSSKIIGLEHFSVPDWVGANQTQVLMSPQNCPCHSDSREVSGPDTGPGLAESHCNIFSRPSTRGVSGCQYVTNRAPMVTDCHPMPWRYDVRQQTQYASSSAQIIAATKSISNKTLEQFYWIVGLIYFWL